MMEEDEQVVEERVSEYGLKRLHVMRSRAPVEVERWVREKVEEGEAVETFYQYQDDLGLYHLRLYWRSVEQAEAMR